MAARGLGFETLREARPDLVYVASARSGRTGPYAHHLATDLTLSAMGGAMSLYGEPDRRPVRITVPQTWYHAAAEGALAALVAHERRLATGEAQFVDVSVQAAVFWTGLNAMIAHAIDGKNIERNGTCAAAQHVRDAARLPVRRRRGDADRHRRPRCTGLVPVDGRERRRHGRVGGGGGLADVRGADADGPDARDPLARRGAGGDRRPSPAGTARPSCSTAASPAASRSRR